MFWIKDLTKLLMVEVSFHLFYSTFFIVFTQMAFVGFDVMGHNFLSKTEFKHDTGNLASFHHQLGYVQILSTRPYCLARVGDSSTFSSSSSLGFVLAIWSTVVRDLL